MLRKLKHRFEKEKAIKETLSPSEKRLRKIEKHAIYRKKQASRQPAATRKTTSRHMKRKYTTLDSGIGKKALMPEHNLDALSGNRNVDLRLPVDSTELIDMFYSIGDQIHHRMTCSFYAGLLEQVGASEFVKEIESLSMEVLLSRRLVVEVEVKIINGEINVEEKDCMAKALFFQKKNSFMPLIILVTSFGMPIIEAKLAVFRKYQNCDLDKIFIHHQYDDNNELSKIIALHKVSLFWLRIARMKLYNEFDDLYKIAYQAIVHILLKENIVKISRAIAIQREEMSFTTFRYGSLGNISQALVDSTIEAVCESLGYEISQNIKRSSKICTTIPDYIYSKLSIKAVKQHLPDIYDSLTLFLSARPDLFRSKYKLEWRQNIAANVCLLINYKKTEIVGSIVEMCRTFEENIIEVCTSLAGFQSQCKPTNLMKLVEEWKMREIFETSDGIERFPSILTYIVGRKNDKICLKVFMRNADDNAECFFKEQGRKLACDVHYDFVNIKEKSEEIRKEVREIEALERKTDKKFMDEKNILNEIVNTEGEKIYAKYSQVIRMGISSVYRRNQQSINKPCIVLYCLDKTLIPFGEKKLPDQIKDYPCDIREDIVVFGSCTNCPYVKEGCDIGSIYFSGSAGFLVISPFEGFLTAAHVTVKNVGDVYQSISNNFDNTNGHKEKIMHPSSSQNMVGEVEKRICGNFFSYGTDVAIVRMDPLIHKSRLSVQIPEKVADEKCLRFDGSLKVTKRGRTTNVTTGTLTEGNSSVRIHSTLKPRCYYSFQNCYTVSDDPENMPFFEEGDSGSGVFLLDDCKRNMTPLGIAFARGDLSNTTFVCKIQHIVQQFELSICQNQEAFAVGIPNEERNEVPMEEN